MLSRELFVEIWTYYKRATVWDCYWRKILSTSKIQMRPHFRTSRYRVSHAAATCWTSTGLRSFTHSFNGDITMVPESFVNGLYFESFCALGTIIIIILMYFNKNFKNRWGFTPFKCILAFPESFMLCFFRSNFPSPIKDVTDTWNYQPKERNEKLHVNYLCFKNIL